MEAQEPQPSPEYLKGFNEGYLIAKDSPGLSEKIASALGISDRATGFKDGFAEYHIEWKKEITPKWLKGDRLSSLNKEDQEKGKDKDDFEHDKTYI